MEMIPFIIGLIIGLFTGTSLMCCVIVGKEHNEIFGKEKK